jgi:flagellar protein FlbB
MKAKHGFTVMFLLILLIIVLFAVVYWFNYLGLVNLPRAYSKIVSRIPAIPYGKDIADPFLLEKEFFDKLKVTYESQFTQLKQYEDQLKAKEEQTNEKEKAISELEASLKEKEENIYRKLKEYDDYKENIKKEAIQFINMPPADAVKVLNNMDILKVVDILRAMDEYFASIGETSLVPYLVSLMPPDRAAKLSEYKIEGATTFSPAP